MKNRRARNEPLVKRYGLLAIAVLGGITAAVTNLDSLANMWHKYFGKPSEIPALGQAFNLPGLRQVKSSDVSLELVQAPVEQTSYTLVFDVYLLNESRNDLLVTKLAYGFGLPYFASATIDSSASRPFSPDSAYEISVQSNRKGDSALSPPYLLKGGSRAAIRFRFTRSDHAAFASSDLSFSLFDSAGHELATINGLK
jgi:hypothetical protein